MLFLASATVLPWLATPSSTQCATYHLPSLCIVVVNVYFMHRSIPEKSSYERCVGCISSFKNEESHLPRLNLVAPPEVKPREVVACCIYTGCHGTRTVCYYW